MVWPRSGQKAGGRGRQQQEKQQGGVYTAAVVAAVGGNKEMVVVDMPRGVEMGWGRCDNSTAADHIVGHC